MSDSSDPTRHQHLEVQFLAHVQKLLSDERLRLPTAAGRKSVVTLQRDVRFTDRGVELKRLMQQMGKPDRKLEAQMPIGKTMDVGLSRKKFWIFKSSVGRVRAMCYSPSESLISGQSPQPMSAVDLSQILSSTPPPLPGIPVTLAIMSTSGFTPEAREAATGVLDRTIILVSPQDAGGWSISANANAKDFAPLFDPELDADKRARIRAEIDAERAGLLTSGLAADKLAAKLQLSPQLIESELKSYARESPGLAVKRMDGRMVLFREGSGPTPAPTRSIAAGGLAMPFIDKMKNLFAHKGEVEKKINFLSERRTALSQQLDRGYEDMGVMEAREAELRQQFKDATGDLPRRRITSQLLQLRKDIQRRQQLLSVLNQQINVVSTHLHNLELQRQGQGAKLPDSEEMAADAATAEEVLAELQAGSELAESVGAGVHGGMSTEEQALYDELMDESKAAAPSSVAPQTTAQSSAASEAPKPQAVKPPPMPQHQREPEAG